MEISVRDPGHLSDVCEMIVDGVACGGYLRLRSKDGADSGPSFLELLADERLHLLPELCLGFTPLRNQAAIYKWAQRDADTVWAADVEHGLDQSLPAEVTTPRFD